MARKQQGDRAAQLPISSITLADGTEVGVAEGVEKAQDATTNLEFIDETVADLDLVTDTAIEQELAVPEWIQDGSADAGFEAAQIAWDQSEFAKDLAEQLETELGEAQADLVQALADAAEALDEAGLARSEAATAVSDASQAVTDAAQAISDALAAANAAAAADGKAVAAQSAAGTAQSAADQAALDAAAAAGIAAGKGKVIIQAGAPATADRLPQNLWIDTTGGANTPKRWDGSAWEPVTDKTALDAAAAAVTAQDRADDAFDEAVAAANAAGAAQLTADGKNRVWYQGTAPAGSGHKTDDVWFNTSQGNRMARWNGTSWVVMEFASAALANSAVTAIKLADEAVTQAKIANGAVGTDELASAVKTTIQNAQDTANNAQSAAGAAQTAAGNAQTTANNAASAAADAAGLAGGKADVLIQSTAPVAAMRKATTLWIDTTGGANTPKRWTTGSTWVAVTDKAATDAANAAAGAQSTANSAHSLATAAQSAASAAQNAADSAAGAAAAAQTTANGRARVVRSTSAASSPGDYKAGDQWWRYSGAEVTGFWLHSGSAWVAQTLDSEIIAHLDAGKITTGYLAAARINANTITGTHIAGATVTAANMVAGTITAASGIIANAAIGSAQIADLAVTAAKIANATITNAEIANGTIQNAKIANLDAAKITTGTLNAARIAANSISTSKLLITSTENLIENGSFEYPDLAGWTNKHSQVSQTTEQARTGTSSLKLTTTTTAYAGLTQEVPFAVAGSGVGDEQYRISAWVYLASGTSANQDITFDFQHGTGPSGTGSTQTNIATIPAGVAAGTWVNVTGIWTVPATAKYARLRIVPRATTAGKIYYVDDVAVYKMATSELIVDGAVLADKIASNAVTAVKIAANAVTAVKIAANAVTAEKINAGAVTTVKLDALAVTAEKLAANAVVADKIAANAITTAKLAATAIDGMTITGALIRTAASGQRVQLDVNGLRTFNSGGTETARLASDGTGIRLTGPLRSWAGGNGDERATLHSGGLSFDNPSGLDTITLNRAGLFSSGGGKALQLENTSAGAGSNIELYVAGNNRIGLHGNTDLYGRLTKSESVRTLWTGAVFLHGTQTISFTENLHDQENGLIFRWSKYSGTAPQDLDFIDTYVDKKWQQAFGNALRKALLHTGGSVSGQYGVKEFRFTSATTVQGVTGNTAGTSNEFVLRQILSW